MNPCGLTKKWYPLVKLLPLLLIRISHFRRKVAVSNPVLHYKILYPASVLWVVRSTWPQGIEKRETCPIFYMTVPDPNLVGRSACQCHCHRSYARKSCTCLCSAVARCYLGPWLARRTHRADTSACRSLHRRMPSSVILHSS